MELNTETKKAMEVLSKKFRAYVFLERGVMVGEAISRLGITGCVRTWVFPIQGEVVETENNLSWEKEAWAETLGRGMAQAFGARAKELTINQIGNFEND